MRERKEERRKRLKKKKKNLSENILGHSTIFPHIYRRKINKTQKNQSGLKHRNESKTRNKSSIK